MSTTTPNLELFKYNTSTDGDLTFSISTALNNNWDKVDKQQTKQKLETLNSGTISLSNVSMYKITPTGAVSFTFSPSNLSLSSNESYTFELYIVLSTVYALTFPNNVSWQDGETPDFSNTGTYFLAFRTIDGGTNWIGNLQGRW